MVQKTKIVLYSVVAQFNAKYGTRMLRTRIWRINADNKEKIRVYPLNPPNLRPIFLLNCKAEFEVFEPCQHLEFPAWFKIGQIIFTIPSCRGDPLGRPKSVKIIRHKMNHVHIRKLNE